jgi:hypothetical protein
VFKSPPDCTCATQQRCGGNDGRPTPEDLFIQDLKPLAGNALSLRQPYSESTPVRHQKAGAASCPAAPHPEAEAAGVVLSRLNAPTVRPAPIALNGDRPRCPRELVAACGRVMPTSPRPLAGLAVSRVQPVGTVAAGVAAFFVRRAWHCGGSLWVYGLFRVRPPAATPPHLPAELPPPQARGSSCRPPPTWREGIRRVLRP